MSYECILLNELCYTNGKSKVRFYTHTDTLKAHSSQVQQSKVTCHLYLPWMCMRKTQSSCRAPLYTLSSECKNISWLCMYVTYILIYIYIYVYIYGDAYRHTYTCLILNSCLYWKLRASDFNHVVASDMHNMKKRCWQDMQQILYFHCDKSMWHFVGQKSRRWVRRLREVEQWGMSMQ